MICYYFPNNSFLQNNMIFDKSQRVKDIFSSVASKYDLMNNIMSLGLHNAWKYYLCNLLTDKNAKLLDCASGSGDIALRFYSKARAQHGCPEVVISDINQDMLEKAKDKCIKANILDIQIICADAENLPFADNSFDYYTISFGIRNVNNITKVLQEALRVLKPEGSFFCLEFSPVTTPIIKNLYAIYSNFIIPNIGSIITGRKDAYEYLIESISQFPSPEDFSIEMQNTGFEDVEYKKFLTGIAVLYRGRKNFNEKSC